ncbi:hypothetical protein DUNSADRAFT_16650 [Dunaliella salina]|uniref:Encoded protein n=1 Tax=Dunaliella salina TaxID=3046 RepID=A0ABQ7G363_DUNSA|nr:hypothetical protein DUNSADRAFT_16650 [Dunaliella salina]|eukprot:KAF5829046.1 hypothetical protein DUNSADRAFT_16650 [Dunaliella salina]
MDLQLGRLSLSAPALDEAQPAPGAGADTQAAPENLCALGRGGQAPGLKTDLQAGQVSLRAVGRGELTPPAPGLMELLQPPAGHVIDPQAGPVSWRVLAWGDLAHPAPSLMDLLQRMAAHLALHLRPSSMTTDCVMANC